MSDSGLEGPGNDSDLVSPAWETDSGGANDRQALAEFGDVGYLDLSRDEPRILVADSSGTFGGPCMTEEWHLGVTILAAEANCVALVALLIAEVPTAGSNTLLTAGAAVGCLSAVTAYIDALKALATCAAGNGDEAKADRLRRRVEYLERRIGDIAPQP